jgi:hypothetical protein
MGKVNVCSVEKAVTRQRMTRLPYWSWLAAMHQSLSALDWKQALLRVATWAFFFQLADIKKGRLRHFFLPQHAPSFSCFTLT